MMSIEIRKVLSRANILCMAVATVLLAPGCTAERSSVADELTSVASSVTAAEPPIDRTSAPRSDVVFTWRDAKKLKGTVFGSSQLLLADLANLRGQSVTGRLVLVTSGLDGRVAERVLEKFTLPQA